MKCGVCNITPLDRDNVHGVCKNYPACRTEWRKRRWNSLTEEEKDTHRARYLKTSIATLLGNAKHRAKKEYFPFDLTRDNLPAVPKHCPCCDRELVRKGPWVSQPSLDRIIPALGYVSTNVQWLCRRCNLVKNNASLDELKTMVEFLERTL